MAQAVITHTNDMLNSFHQNALLTRPEGRRLTQLEHEMANILARTDMSDRQKMEQFSHTLQNFQKVRGVIIDNGLMLTSTNSTVLPAEEQENQAQAVFSKIQEVIKEALQADQTQANVPQPSSNVAFTAKKVKKVKKTPATKKASVGDIVDKRLTRAAARKREQNKTPAKTPAKSQDKILSYGAPSSGPDVQYTPYSSSKKLQRTIAGLDIPSPKLKRLQATPARIDTPSRSKKSPARVNSGEKIEKMYKKMEQRGFVSGQGFVNFNAW